MRHAGIILKRYMPKQHKLCVFDRVWGKIDCVPEREYPIERLSVGTLIFYYSEKQRRRYYPITNVDMVRAPFAAARSDLLFVHHVLEIAYNFISFEQHDNALFELLTFACAHGQLLRSAREKKLFLFKLFVVLGMYPEGSLFRCAELHCLAVGAIDNLFDLNIDLKIEKELDYWLLKCIAMYPGADNFKTGHFIIKNRVS